VHRGGYILTPINGISKFTKLFSAGKAQKIISNLLTSPENTAEKRKNQPKQKLGGGFRMLFFLDSNDLFL
jgi:hypothetical protein